MRIIRMRGIAANCNHSCCLVYRQDPGTFVHKLAEKGPDASIINDAPLIEVGRPLINGCSNRFSAVGYRISRVSAKQQDLVVTQIADYQIVDRVPSSWVNITWCIRLCQLWEEHQLWFVGQFLKGEYGLENMHSGAICNEIKVVILGQSSLKDSVRKGCLWSFLCLTKFIRHGDGRDLTNQCGEGHE